MTNDSYLLNKFLAVKKANSETFRFDNFFSTLPNTGFVLAKEMFEGWNAELFVCYLYSFPICNGLVTLTLKPGHDSGTGHNTRGHIKIYQHLGPQVNIISITHDS